ncbi:hypothetical protein H0H92_014929 [Tricholoma furcatifolium]|nr:hypothetical protein H0H92_014929 [Tricholoma furcatifolium]
MHRKMRLIFLTTVKALLEHCQLLDSPLVPTRLAKAVLPLLSVVLATPSPSESQSPEDVGNSQKSKKGKKRARGYEGDEVFKLTREVICPGPEDGKVLLAALNVMRLLLQSPNLSPSMQSISARVLLSILLGLPQISPASLSPDLVLYDELVQLVQSITAELGSGTTSVMSKSLSMVVRAAIAGNDNEETLRDLEILLHPRVPPLVRSLPHVESLSLFSAEEPQEEADVRRDLGLHVVAPSQPPAAHAEEDVVMKDAITAPVVSVKPIDSATSPLPKPLPSATAAIQSLPAPQTLPSPVVIERPHIQPPVAAQKNTPRPAVPQPVQPVTVPNPLDEEDEEMPEINMDSDSDEE